MIFLKNSFFYQHFPFNFLGRTASKAKLLFLVNFILYHAVISRVGYRECIAHHFNPVHGELVILAEINHFLALLLARVHLTSPAMENLFVAFAHILATIAKLLRLGGAKRIGNEERYYSLYW